MPREHRPPKGGTNDKRPAFARPPGAPRASESPASGYVSGSPHGKARRKRKSRTTTREFDLDDEGFEDDEQDESDLPHTPIKSSHRQHRHSRDPSKAKNSPIPSPEKEARRPRHQREASGTWERGQGHVHSRESGDIRGQNVEARRQHKRKISAPVRQSTRAERELDRTRDRAKYSSGTSTNSTSQLLSANSLAQLNAKNSRAQDEEDRAQRKKAKESKEKQYKGLRATEAAEKRRRRKGREVSGAIMEEGRAAGKVKRRDRNSYGYDDENEEWNEKRRVSRSGGGGGGAGFLGWKNWSRRKKLMIVIGLSLVVLLIIIIAAVVASKKSKSGGTTSTSSSSGSSTKNTCSASDVPASAKGTYTDISTWLDTTDFNCTYTSETVGNLSVMGLMSSWDDSKQANANVPALNKQWQYGTLPIRGTNLGGWLDLEPFITPSMFNYAASDNVVDEWTLCQKLGSSAAQVLESHYATFITKQDFADIASAGLDHVRIPYPYWAVKTYDGDPYVPQIAWRYLLRGIEWAREYGIRVNLDLHSAPGSQNGWAHSGHQGSIDWIMGDDGTENAQRTIDIHNQLSQFFAQARYDNVVTIYGLVNEPKMLVIPVDSVLDWNKKAISTIRGNGIKQYITFGDGFLTLEDWDDMFKGVDSSLVLDTHQYQIFNVNELKLKHQDKINLVCTGWAGMLVAVNNNSTGWGPTLSGEWSQADTDCTEYLNNVGVGSRWAGTLNTGNATTSVTTQTCASPPCSCDIPNADPSKYPTSYKTFLKMYAEAQMYAFEQVWGWFYWTWKTESATQWSWKLGLAAGILPAKAYEPDFRCNSTVPDFSDLSESY